jgi:hypothetical protein
MANPNAPRGAAVRNAADPRQVRFAERLEKQQAERFARALAGVMSTPEGRIVMANLIRRAGVYKSIWHPSSEIHYNAGRQDYGHELMADLVRLSEETYQLMEREEWAWAKHQQATIDAAHTARSDGGQTDER